MPIYEQNYRSYDGEAWHHFRWLIIVEQEVRVLIKQKKFLVLMIVGLVHLILRVLQLVAMDIIAQNPNHPLALTFKQFDFLSIDQRMFFDFIRFQGPLTVVLFLLAGSGMICNDFRNNIMELYFSKPISWRDYALGKIATLTGLGLFLTAIPALFLMMLHNILLPGAATFAQTITWVVPTILFSLLLVIPAALMVLACSAVVNSFNYAAVTMLMIIVASATMGTVLAEMLRAPNYQVISLPLAYNRLGQYFYGMRYPIFELDWYWPMSIFVAISLISLNLVFRKVRRAEVAP
ncbi:MAG: ABC transporter permease subunit [Candidatus Hydrogenedentes bacterium]|nr:ABC transporter permease subunit [Candidatus Hydrogenedentota bacterium]